MSPAVFQDKVLGQESQSHRTDQSSSRSSPRVSHRGLRPSPVTIPPKRSGQFQKNPASTFLYIRVVPSDEQGRWRRGPASLRRNSTLPIRVVQRIPSVQCASKTASSRNPTVQIRVVPSFCFECKLLRAAEPSQSHRTDKGSSKRIKKWGRNARLLRTQSQSRRADQGSSKAGPTRATATRRQRRNPTVHIRAVPRNETKARHRAS